MIVSEDRSLKEMLKSLKRKPVLLSLLMGFSSGIPLLLTLRTLQAWMTEASVDLKTIGLFAFVGIPYSWKFIWAPFVDKFNLTRFGRRKSWLLCSQFFLGGFIFILGTLNPLDNIELFAFLCVLVAFSSATQDIVIDAYRRETLTDAEQGLGSTFYIYGYRVAMWVAGAGALFLATLVPWSVVYKSMAVLVWLCMLLPLWADEPEDTQLRKFSFIETIYLPLADFFTRTGAVYILLFVLLYKVGDAIAGNMAMPYYLMIGFNKADIAAIAKTLSLPATLIGGAIGGVLVYRWKLKKALFVIGVLQILSTIAFSTLEMFGPNRLMFAGVVLFEDISGAMGSAAITAFVALLTKREFTATQFALLTSLMSVPRTFISAPAGYLAEGLGWTQFFWLCGLVGVPGLLLLVWKIHPESDLP